MSPGLSLRGPDIFKPLKRNISTREAAVSVHCLLGVWPRAVTLQHCEQKLAASPVSGPEEPPPCHGPVLSFAVPTGHAGPPPGFCVPGWRLAHRSSEISPSCTGGLLCTTSSGVPCHPIAQLLRLQAAGPWESTPSQEAALPSEWHSGRDGTHSPRCSKSHEICLRLPLPEGEFLPPGKLEAMEHSPKSPPDTQEPCLLLTPGSVSKSGSEFPHILSGFGFWFFPFSTSSFPSCLIPRDMRG